MSVWQLKTSTDRLNLLFISCHAIFTFEMASTVELSQFIVPNNVPFNFLDCKKALNALSSKEKLYAHYLSRASWEGARICLIQTSPESPGIFLLFQKLFAAESVQSFYTSASKDESGLTFEEIKVCLKDHVIKTLICS